jgi:hypothetical protein
MPKSTPECREGCEVHEKWLKSGDIITGLESEIIKLNDELDCLKSDTVRTMTLCDCKKFYRLSSEKLCDKCTITKLRDRVKSHKAALDLIAGEGHMK